MNRKRVVDWFRFAVVAAAAGLSAGSPGYSQVARNRLLPPGPDNPRNSEGDFIQLRDGRVMFIYSHFYGGGGDHAAARLAARYSNDGGQTWTESDRVVVEREGDMNVMSVSLLRLEDDRIALFYLRKNSLTDCRPLVRFSTDEGQTFSDPTVCITDQVGYYVMNNDRALQLESGRIVLPVALHNTPEQSQPDWAGTVMCYLSDDQGRTWRRSRSQMRGQREGRRVMVQEPGVVPLADGRLMMFCRTDDGSQYVAWSRDSGDTWSELQPSNIHSPRSPATIERIPGSDALLMVWNDHRDIDDALRDKRTPLHVAVSRDHAETWESVRVLEDNVHGWFCYTAMTFVDDHVLLAYCAGDRREGNGLELTQITRFPLDWIKQ